MARCGLLIALVCAAAASSTPPNSQAHSLRSCRGEGAAPATRAGEVLTALRGGGEDARKKHEMSHLSRIIRWAALGLHAWAYLVGHVNSITIISPAFSAAIRGAGEDSAFFASTIDAVGKLPYTIQLPSRAQKNVQNAGTKK